MIRLVFKNQIIACPPVGSLCRGTSIQDARISQYGRGSEKIVLNRAKRWYLDNIYVRFSQNLINFVTEKKIPFRNPC